MAATSVLAGTSAGLQIFSGILGLGAADLQNESLRRDARLLKAESEAEIARYARQAEAFKADQSVRILKSGVAIEGSPLAIIDETTRVAAENISAMRAKATAQARELRIKGREVVSASRANLLGGVASAAAVTANTGKNLGWWSPQRPSRTDFVPDTRWGGGGKLDLTRGW